tara:strand:+ start:740 stop:1207 length:468 start_codon:yes stop_codon:yes gene_type:complete
MITLMPSILEKPTPIHAMDIFNMYLFFVFLYFYIKKNKVGREKIFLNIVFLLPFIHFIGRIFYKPRLYNVYHVLLALFLIIATGCSNDIDILFVILSMLILTISTRKIYDGCLVRKYETNSILTHNTLSEQLNWDWIFLSLSLLSLFKIYKITIP